MVKKIQKHTNQEIIKEVEGSKNIEEKKEVQSELPSIVKIK